MTIEPERYELFEGPRYSFDLERRDFIRLLGGGLVVIAAIPRVGAQQESGRGGQRGETADLGAWLHIDQTGKITAYTGKVEIGQNIRTSLAQAVAEELRVPMESIALVMADTDLTPYDAGTFGSQTTPRMSRQLTRAAATAREMLVDRAAAKWQVDRATLSVRDGQVVGAGRTISFGELTPGEHLTGVVAAEPAVTPADKWQVRGKAEKKIDGRSFVTGAHRFTPDVVRPGMAFGRVVRPPAIGASLATLDDTAVRAMTGVTFVRDGDFIGVVAPNERVAARAAAAVKATWTERADQPSSETIFDYLKQGQKTAADVGRAPGQIAGAKVEAARTFSASYRIPYIAHVPLEPRAAVAEWVRLRPAGDAPGYGETGRLKLTVWTGTQRPFGVRAELASAFKLREDQVRVIVPDMGSAYGGKHSGEAAIEAARLAKAAGKPVKLVWTRAEEFMWAYFRPAGVIDVGASVDASGRIVDWQFDNWNSGTAGIASPYNVPQRTGFHPASSPLRQGSYRGLAATANHYAREMHMDHVARELKTDAVEFRLRHITNDRLRAVLVAAAQKAGWPRPSVEGRALGIACGTEKGSYVATAAELSRAGSSFKIERLVVAFECGAIVNPDGLRNQVEGSVVQGLGGALFEAVEFRDGRILNGSLAKYRVPRFRDVPPIEIVLLDRKDLPPAGAGETPIVCVAPAIGSAARVFGVVAAALPVTLA
jgi:CO/xanthine dehydrogenase Mo-binding subunit